MTTKYIDVRNDKWGILLCYDYCVRDYDDIWAICRSFGMCDCKIRKSLQILSAPNTGMTISNSDLRMSAVFISDATSKAEWLDSLAHELFHAVIAIIDHYGVSYEGEPSAYLYGDLMRDVIKAIKS